MGQVGQTSLAVVPTMKGLRAKVNAESKAAAKLAGRSMETEFGKTGVRAGRSMSRGFRSGRDGAKKMLEDVTRANAQATAAWSKENRAHLDAVGRVRVAQAKLTEATKKYGEESVQVVSAQERLASAQRRVEETTVRSRTAYEKMQGTQKQLKAATDAASDAAGKQGGIFSRIFGGVGRAASAAAGTVRSVLGPGLSAVWSGIKSAAAAAGRAIGTAIKGGALVAGIAITGLLTKAFVGGFSRLSSIENAEAKMRGLGFAAKDIQAAMDGASEAVDGTAFSLDEMASAASVAMAAGVKPGKQLNGYMATLKNAAAAANVPLGEMGQILNKTVTAGRAYTMEINQIGDRGLPIWSKLQEAYGVTAEEMRKMVSEGKVDSETFLQIMDEMTGSVADAMGNTTTAKIKNFGTALSKLGADVLQGVYPVVGPLFDALKAGAQMMQAVLKPAFDQLGESVSPVSERLQGFVDKWAEIKEQIAGGGDPLALISAEWPKFGAVLEKIRDGVLKLPDVFERLGGIFETVSGVVGPLAEKLGPVLADAMTELMEALEPVLPALGEALLTAVTELGPPLVELLDALLPLVPPLVDLVAALAPLVATLVEELLPFVTPIIEFFTGMVEAVSELFGVMDGSTGLKDFSDRILQLEGPFGNLMRWIMDITGPLAVLVAKIFIAGIRIQVGISNVINWIVGFIARTMTSIRLTWDAIWTAISTTVVTIMATIRTTISTVVTAVSQAWSNAWNTAKAIFEGFVNGIRTGIQTVGSILSGLRDTIWNAISGIGTWLVDAGKSLIEGLANGIRDGFSAAADAVTNGLEWLRGFLPFSPAKRGPLSGAGWRKLHDSGRAYAAQWTGGIEDGLYDDFDFPDLVRGLDPSEAARAIIGGRDSGRPVEQTNLNINGPVYGDPEHIVTVIDRKKRRSVKLEKVRSIK